MTNLKIDSSDTLRSFLDILVEESIRRARIDTQVGDQEKTRQSEMEKQLQKWPLGSESINEKELEVEAEEVDVEVDPENVGETEPQVEEMKVNLSQVILNLNTIRSGKSLRHKEINLELSQYFDNLDQAEKIALIKFLEGLAQIIAGGVDGDRAVEPDDEPDPVKISSEKEEVEVEQEDDEELAPETKPPVKVSKESQDSLRKSIRALLH